MEMEKLSLPSGKLPPKDLYHYTSIDGVKGILGENCLWASQIHFLNDTQEFKYSISILDKVLAELQKELPEKKEMGWWSLAIKLTEEPPPPISDPNTVLSVLYGTLQRLFLIPAFAKSPICVFSLSEEGDLLSQWRGYSPSGGGYSIGFRSDSLIKFLETRELYLAPCIYDEAEQRTVVKETVTKVCDTILKRWPGGGVEGDRVDEFIQEDLLQFLIDFSRIASGLKHPSFHQENEWRIISSLVLNQNMSFRVRKFYDASLFLNLF